MRWVKRILLALGALVLVLCLAVVGVVLFIRTPTGQRFVVHEVNTRGKAYIHISGVRGELPSNFTIASLTLKDPRGTWLEAEDVTLRWSPLALFRGALAVRALTAQQLEISRPPSYPKAKTKSGGGLSLPVHQIKLTLLEIGRLSLAPALAGQALTLHVIGHASVLDANHATLTLNADEIGNAAFYHLNFGLDPRTISLQGEVHEPADGLLAHLAGAKTAPPITASLTLAGPRQTARLNGLVTLGAARLTLAGVVNTTPQTPGADITLALPDLAAFGALAHQTLAGTLTVHLLASHKKTSTKLALNGVLDMHQAPKAVGHLLMGQTKLSLLATIQGPRAELTQFSLTGPAFSAMAHGEKTAKQLDLTANAKLPQLAALLPQLHGTLNMQAHVFGALEALHANATLSGQISADNIPSGPFNLTLQADDLPAAPHGTLTGNGTLAGAPLVLNAQFARTAAGATRIDLTKALWNSLDAQADLSLVPGANLPTGTARVRITRLADLNIFTHTRLQGGLNAQFAYQKNQTLTLNLTTHALGFGSALTGLDSEVAITGPLEALTVKLAARATSVMSHPAWLNANGSVDVPAQSVTLSSLRTGWQSLAVRLLAPATLVLKPELKVDTLKLAVNRGTLVLNGMLSPTLNATASVHNLDLSLARLFAPKLHVAGTINAMTTLTGTPKAPEGRVTLNASGLRYLTQATSGLPAADINGNATLKGQHGLVDVTLRAGPQLHLTLRGDTPLAMTQRMDLRLDSFVALPLLDPLLHTKLSGTLSAKAHLTGTPQAPAGQITLKGQNLHDASGEAAALAPASLNATASIKNQRARLMMAVMAGPDIRLNLQGDAPLVMTKEMNLALSGHVDLKALDPILAANGSLVRGVITTALRLTGTPRAPRGDGTLNLANGSLLNISSGLNLTHINAQILAADQEVTLQSLTAKAGNGEISGAGRINLSGAMPVDLVLKAYKASPIISDLVTEKLNAALTLQGDLKTGTRLGGEIDILTANINIPHSLPASVANLPIHYVGEPPPAPHHANPPPPIGLALVIRAQNQIFIRGDGLFAELGGNLKLGGTLDAPAPTGGFTLIRGSFSLAGKTLAFTTGKIDFNGDGFIPSLDLEATTTTNNGGTASLVISGTAAKPKIELTSTPPLPSDEILAQLLFAQSSSSLSPFQAASLAAALAQIAGVGGGFSPLESARNALGLDQLSLESSGHGAPSIQAGRYVAPGVYVGASQSASGQGTKATVEINLYKGLKLQSSTGTDSTGQSSSSVGLSYQYNY